MHAVTKFQSYIDFLWFSIITCTNPLVWYSCQEKQSASSEWANIWWVGYTCFLVAASPRSMQSVSPGQTYSNTVTNCHTERETLHIKLAISHSHSILTPCQPVPAVCKVYLQDRPAQTLWQTTVLSARLHTNLAISPSHSTLTLCQPVPALTL